MPRVAMLLVSSPPTREIVPAPPSGYAPPMQTPHRLTPVAVGRPWGGGRFGTVEGERVGELWLTGDDARLDDGRSLAESGLAGDVPLVKLLDVGGLLSVQVHPDDGLARAMYGPGSVGKHEMWVVLEAVDDAQLYLGLAPGAGVDALYSGDAETVRSAMRRLQPRRGEAIDVPPGTVHAPGPGLVLYEVMQRSDITFRIFDWGRPRPLHVDESRRALRPLAVPEPIEAAGGVGRWTLSDAAAPFRVERMRVAGDPVVLAADVPMVVSVVEGEPELGRPGGEKEWPLGVEGYWPLEAGSHWLLEAGAWTVAGSGEVLVAASKP